MVMDVFQPMHCLGRLCFFFFQAEDGIRDPLVTGVQTCALPISHEAGTRLSHVRAMLLYSATSQPRRKWITTCGEIDQIRSPSGLPSSTSGCGMDARIS